MNDPYRINGHERDCGCMDCYDRLSRRVLTMIDPWRQPPGHSHDCPCEECQEVRERWAANQPAMIEELSPEDGEDSDTTD